MDIDAKYSKALNAINEAIDLLSVGEEATDNETLDLLNKTYRDLVRED